MKSEAPNEVAVGSSLERMVRPLGDAFTPIPMVVVGPMRNQPAYLQHQSKPVKRSGVESTIQQDVHPSESEHEDTESHNLEEAHKPGQTPPAQSGRFRYAKMDGLSQAMRLLFPSLELRERLSYDERPNDKS